MDDWLARPAALFDIRGKSAVVVGASGAFGALAASVLAAAGARLTIAASKADKLADVARECVELGVEVEIVQRRSNTEADANAITAAAVQRFGGVDILVVAAGMNDVCAIVEMSPERFAKVMEANVTGTWLMAKAAGAQM